jgi:hypothetical protein
LGLCHPSIIFQNKNHLHEIEGSNIFFIGLENSNWLVVCVKINNTACKNTMQKLVQAIFPFVTGSQYDTNLNQLNKL